MIFTHLSYEAASSRMSCTILPLDLSPGMSYSSTQIIQPFDKLSLGQNLLILSCTKGVFQKQQGVNSKQC